MQYLFERLASSQPDPHHAPGKEEIQLSVLRQLQCIVASRPWLDGEDGGNLLSFGQPAVPDLAAGNALQLRRYGERLRQMIERFEPRLENPSVAVETGATPSAPVRVMITGQLRWEDDILPVLMASEPRID